MKSQAVKDLELAYMVHHYEQRPNIPEYARVKKSFDDTTANGLTKCIIAFIQMNGGQAERISTTGRYVDKSRTFTDVLGHQRRIGTGQWIKGNTTTGSADISATISGRSVKIEVKIGKDRQSEAQREYQKNIERAGGLYFIAKDFAMFRQWFADTFQQ